MPPQRNICKFPLINSNSMSNARTFEAEPTLRLWICILCYGLASVRFFVQILYSNTTNMPLYDMLPHHVIDIIIIIIIIMFLKG